MDVVIPKIGMTMVEATVVEWLQPDGAHVTEGEPVYVLATDKVESEVEAEATGTLRHGVAAGVTLPVGSVVGWLVRQGDPVPNVGDRVAVGGAAPREAGRRHRLFASPNARRLAAEHGIDLRTLVGTGTNGRIVGADVPRSAKRPWPPASTQHLVPAATSAARIVAARLGVDLTGLATNDGAPITRSQVEREVAARLRATPATATDSTALGPMTGMRSTIATRLHRSLQEMAQLSIGMEARVGRILALRAELKDDPACAAVPTITDFVIRASALALLGHPELNASIVDDSLQLHDRPHIGVAVAVDGGLLVPVVRNADRLSVRAIAETTVALGAAARGGELRPGDLSDSTFCVTSLGSRGVDFFTPIVNPPNVAILGVGRVHDGVRFTGKRRTKPVRVDVLTLSLTFDHRAVDGAPAAEFLGAIRDSLERPARLM